MNARTLQAADLGSPLEVLPPVLFNTYKHHAAALRERIRETARAGEGALAELAGRMAVLGTKLMDLYTGALWPRDLSARVRELLRGEGRLEQAAFRGWVE